MLILVVLPNKVNSYRCFGEDISDRLHTISGDTLVVPVIAMVSFPQTMVNRFFFNSATNI